MRPNAVVPVYATDGAAGLDLYTATHQTVAAGKIARVALGVAVAIPPGYVGDVRPRSGLTLSGLLVQYGTVDEDFRGELAAIVWNTTTQHVVLVPGQRIAQLVVLERPRVTLVEVETLDETARGANGFGHTGNSALANGPFAPGTK